MLATWLKARLARLAQSDLLLVFQLKDADAAMFDQTSEQFWHDARRRILQVARLRSLALILESQARYFRLRLPVLKFLVL